MPFIQYSYTLYATETGETRKGKSAKLNFEVKGATVFFTYSANFASTAIEVRFFDGKENTLFLNTTHTVTLDWRNLFPIIAFLPTLG